jgi:hypothetical protein
MIVTLALEEELLLHTKYSKQRELKRSSTYDLINISEKLITRKNQRRLI